MKKAFFISVIVLCAAGLSFAKDGFGLYGIGGKIGFISVDDVTELSFGAAADLGSLMDGQLGLQADITYWGDSETFSGTKVSASLVCISAIGKFFFVKPGEQLRPWAGGGLGINIHSAKVGSYSDSSTDIGGQIGGGVDIKLSDSMKGIGECRFNMNSGPMGNYLTVFAGIIFNLGN